MANETNTTKNAAETAATVTTIDEQAIRAQVEAELRAQIEAETKAKFEAEAAKTSAPKQKEREKVVTPNYSDAELDAQAKRMGEMFKGMGKTKIRIPKNPLNKEDMVVPVCINGYIFQIKRGESVEVPEEVARILEESGYLG
jgi:hypothetical protein